jgi:hypothetical protein
VAWSLSFPFKISGYSVSSFRVSSLLFLSSSFRKSQISQILSHRPPPILLRAKESKDSSTNEDEERVTREGQPESLDRGLGFFIFRCFRFMRCGAGQGSSVEKIINPRPTRFGKNSNRVRKYQRKNR